MVNPKILGNFSVTFSQGGAECALTSAVSPNIIEVYVSEHNLLDLGFCDVTTLNFIFVDDDKNLAISSLYKVYQDHASFDMCVDIFSNGVSVEQIIFKDCSITSIRHLNPLKKSDPNPIHRLVMLGFRERENVFFVEDAAS